MVLNAAGFTTSPGAGREGLSAGLAETFLGATILNKCLVSRELGPGKITANRPAGLHCLWQLFVVFCRGGFRRRKRGRSRRTGGLGVKIPLGGGLRAVIAG